ncbi:hypothetical protein [Candidatus Villigracilis saccharophilus]|uniref:hypothetical protein n=1 Tax=Candidatus Villigracilis saccharophilus TaxID=3140684 RepID=UPI0031EB4AA0
MAEGAVASVPADLVKACKDEGMLSIIATPASWANYGEIFELFKATTVSNSTHSTRTLVPRMKLPQSKPIKEIKALKLPISLMSVTLMGNKALMADITSLTKSQPGTRSLKPF